MKRTFSVLSLMTLVGCAQIPYGGTYRFDGPGTFQNFAQARYECAQETSQRVSGGFVNQYGGVASSRVMPSCSAFNACLAARGYYRNPNGRLDASSMVVSCSP